MTSLAEAEVSESASAENASAVCSQTLLDLHTACLLQVVLSNQVVHKSQMSAFEVVGAVLIIRTLVSHLPPPLYAPATKHVCDK